MLNRISFFMSIILSLLWTVSALAGTDMKEGLWEITTKMEMPGMPMQMPAIKYTQCLTKENMVPQKPEERQECKVISKKFVGDTFTWEMECQIKEGMVHSQGKVTYKDDSFDGMINTLINDPSQGKMEVTNHISGKRIGNCN